MFFSGIIQKMIFLNIKFYYIEKVYTDDFLIKPRY